MAASSLPEPPLRAATLFPASYPGLFLLFAAPAFWFAGSRLVREWSNNPSGELLPIVCITALALWWQQTSDHSLSLTTHPHRTWSENRFLPPVLLIASCCLLTIDAMIEEESILALGIWSGVCGLVFLLARSQTQTRVRFPLLLLLFCLPLPGYVAFHYVHYPLQKLSTLWTTGMLNIFGHQADSSGTIITIGSRTLQVVEECSGVRFLTALTFTALLAGHLRLRSHAHLRMVLFLSAIPLAILTNVLRLTAAGHILIWRGPEAANAFIHGSAVGVFYLAAISLLIVLTRLFIGLTQLPIVLNDSINQDILEVAAAGSLNVSGDESEGRDANHAIERRSESHAPPYAMLGRGVV
ncbi:MAG TPA: exosortase/archaeosortase family protein, partial [Candidatus Ozemobacteraceae bacterium]|nr:exosortase/archaeosortase family protein [Candidatus Ozemobacteraceae bacterium]